MDEGGNGFVLELWLVCVHESVVVYMHVLSAWVLLFCLCSLAFPYVLASVFSFACAPLAFVFACAPCFACVCSCFCFCLLDFAFAYACLFLLLLVSFCFGSGLGDRKMRGRETK